MKPVEMRPDLKLEFEERVLAPETSDLHLANGCI